MLFFESGLIVGVHDKDEGLDASFFKLYSLVNAYFFGVIDVTYPEELTFVCMLIEFCKIFYKCFFINGFYNILCTVGR